AHEDCARRGAVALPQLRSMDAVVGPKEHQPIAEARQVLRAGAERPGPDLRDLHGPRRRPVALPQLRSARAVVGGAEQQVAGRGAVAAPQLDAGLWRDVAGVGDEQDDRAERDELVGERGGDAGVDVEDERRPSTRAVAGPQLGPGDAIVGPEEGLAAGDRDAA